MFNVTFFLLLDSDCQIFSDINVDIHDIQTVSIGTQFNMIMNYIRHRSFKELFVSNDFY